METKYWRSIEELENGKPVDQDKLEKEQKKAILSLSDKELNTPASRRNFLKLVGFSVTAATLAAACEKPVQKAIPYLIKPERIIPGKASYYASTYMEGGDYCSILVKVRDGRPIKIEGNELSTLTRGGTSARVQASVLSLYDSARLQEPTYQGKPITWTQADHEIIQQLDKINAAGGSIHLVTPTVHSPSTLAAIGILKKKYAGLNHVVYEPVSVSSILEANGLSFGQEVIPDYKFEAADLIVGFNADFLGTWIFPLNYAPRYISRRKLTEGQRNISRHIQLETNLTITGGKADQRIPIRASEEKLILASLYSKLAAKVGLSVPSAVNSPINIDFLADELLSHQGKSLVVSGSSDLESQLIVNAINQILGNIGTTIDFSRPVKVKQNKDSEFAKFVEDLDGAKPQGIIFYQVNPIYDYPETEKLADLLKKVQLTVGIYDRVNETAPQLQYTLASHHYLESWNDAEPVHGHYSLAQPAIQNIFNTRQFQDNLLIWAGSKQNYYDFIRATWLTGLFPKSDTGSSFDSFWNKSLQDGILEIKTSLSTDIHYNAGAVNTALSASQPSGKDMPEVHLYESIAIGNGWMANNPWLQELPDPISKVTWENYAAVSPALAKEKGWKNGSVITINKNITLPVVIQPGQHDTSISIAVGYGHTHMGKVADKLGANVYSLLKVKEQGRISNYTAVESYVATGDVVKLAQTQEHDSMEGRPIVRETSLNEYLKNPESGNEMHREFEEKHLSLYDPPQYDGFKWGMNIDLNACIGCSACVIGCQAENNIPVVGKKQVELRRVMHWIRIDRYYSAKPENPSVLFQPMTCQHCSQAPCENVCPVSATNHSSEGISQMAYNRCVGTKYCINNCPYKVRRFNWYRFATNKAFDYNMNEDLGRMVLNPDVVVRERGVVEKCSFCIQRIQEKKLNAKLESRPLRDGELQTACAQACPTKAITFGNTLDPQSEVSRLSKDQRNYYVLEELHTLPSIGYLTLIRNMKEDENA